MMTFIADVLSQQIKTGYRVCGDHCAVTRTDAGTLYVLCDGIGSGIYANIAAIMCTQRLTSLIQNGMTLREAAELVAGSMHRAREADIPFSAFSAAFITPDAYFTLYTYEAPTPILLTSDRASVLPAKHFTADYEVIAECEGRLRHGDALILMSDGVTQSGMGHGYGLGIGSEGVAEFINKQLKTVNTLSLPGRVTAYCASLAKGRYEDDTTLAMLCCREAAELTFLSGPPSRMQLDKLYADIIRSQSAGKKVVCGSTTLDIISRELGVPAETVSSGAFGAPPEYALAGVDLALEGAITLNQVCNVIEEPMSLFEEETAVKKLCVLLKEADVVHMHIGNAANDAHESLFFKQVGVRVRRNTVKLLADKLRGMGKLVLEKYY